MFFWQLNSLAAFAISCVFAGVLIPKILLIAFRKRLFDEPDERKIHHSTVPRLGGIAFVPVVFFCLLVLLAANLFRGDNRILEDFGKNALELSAGACSLMLMYLIGIADDLIGVKYRAKLIFQVLSALMLMGAGMGLDNLCGFADLYEIPAALGIPLSVLLVVFMINAVNLIDGIDGLASGLSAVALTYYGVLFLMVDQYTYAMVAFSSLGTVVPFFYYNVFGKAESQKKIFMGDTGSLTIGVILSFLSLKMTETTMGTPVGDRFNPLVLAFAPLLVPCMDVVRVYFYRIRNHVNPFLPDKNHIHHKLLALGVSPRKAMICIILGSSLCTALCVVASQYLNNTIVLLLCILAFTLLNLYWRRQIDRRDSQK